MDSNTAEQNYLHTSSLQNKPLAHSLTLKYFRSLFTQIRILFVYLHNETLHQR